MTARLLHACRRHLFATPLDGAITLALCALGLWCAQAVGAWALHSADWTAVASGLHFLLAGVAPDSADAVIWSLVAVLCALLAFAYLALRRGPGRAFAPVLVAGLALAAVLVGLLGLDKVGGLLLSVLMTCAAAVLSFPLGVLLALGRRSRFAALGLCCAAYIELVRSLPLLLVVYMVWVAWPLVSPQHVPDDFYRGLAGLVLFFAAFMAEYVRSGLQSVGKGQLDAARALGLGAVDTHRHVVFPQALRVIVPTVAGAVLDIFNATPLLFIIGMTDFLRAGQLMLASSAYTGRELEIYAFLLAVYFAIGSLLTFASRRLEGRGSHPRFHHG